MLDYVAFLSCQEFAILNSFYQDIIFKPKQVICLEGIFLQNDVLCVLPTGYGKSLISTLRLLHCYLQTANLAAIYSFPGSWKEKFHWRQLIL